MRKICIVTGTRAEYGLLRWLMEEIARDPELTLQLLVTGAHLSPEFGLTYGAIEEDGFAIDAKVEMLLSSDTPVGVTKSLGLGVIGLGEALDRLRPDILVLLGDRYETLAAAQAALIARIPVAHIHGGELTTGAIDDSIRHAVTKLSHLHFVAAEPYRRRVIQMGEQAAFVHDVGAPGLDNLRRLRLLERPELERAIGFTFGKTNFLVTYHPVTLGETPPEPAVLALLEALDRVDSAHIIFTRPNADVEGRIIGRLIDEYVARNAGRTAVFASLGQVNYLSVLRLVDCVIGNSSSGILEAPACGTATVNIGLRQDGRLRTSSIIDCNETASEIEAAIRRATSPQFRAGLRRVASSFGAGNSAAAIKRILRETPLEGILRKRFLDL